MKAPESKKPVINSLHRQRACIENLLRVLRGLPIEDNLLLNYRLWMFLYISVFYNILYFRKYDWRRNDNSENIWGAGGFFRRLVAEEYWGIGK